MDTNMVQLGVPLAGSAAVPGNVPPVSGKAPATMNLQDTPAQTASSDEAKFDAKLSDKVRKENLQLAAEMMATDIYVVGDMKFSIYKDGTGQYVTRFTSLRDGAVTYIPEQDMMLYMESRGARRKALLQLDV